MNAKEARTNRDAFKKHKFTDTVSQIIESIRKIHLHVDSYTFIGVLSKEDVEQLKTQGFGIKQEKKITIISW